MGEPRPPAPATPTICFSICSCPASPNMRICRLKRLLFIRCESVFPHRRTKPLASWDKCLVCISEDVHPNNAFGMGEFILPQDSIYRLLAPHHCGERFAAEFPFGVLC